MTAWRKYSDEHWLRLSAVVEALPERTAASPYWRARIAFLAVLAPLAATVAFLQHPHPDGRASSEAVGEEENDMKTSWVAMTLVSALVSPVVTADNHVLSFEAVGQYMQIPHNASQNAASGGLTVECWYKYTSLVPTGRFGKSAPSDCEWGITPDGFYRCGSTSVLVHRFGPGEWHHIAGTFDPNSGLVRYYQDGMLVGSQEGFAPTAVTNYPIFVGLQPGYSDSQWYGAVDNIRIWNYARTQQQIEQMKSVQLTSSHVPNHLGLIASWSFEDGANDATGVNNGTLFGGASIIVDSSLPLDPPCPGDLDASDSVTGVDLAIVLTNWNAPNPKYPEADVNGDGAVDGADLAIVLSNWGDCP
jgi:hypothetical protein